MKPPRSPHGLRRSISASIAALSCVSTILFMPPCVGKTVDSDCSFYGQWKHPHVRGEDPHPASTLSSILETPPRAWGRLGGRADRFVYRGNTPTCVGKTANADVARANRQKHPHVRGEDLCISYCWNYAIETPPRAWGRLLLLSLVYNTTRNTPTCVGKTRPRPTSRPRPWKHPHVRGED